jgi:hypothetical protein
VEIGVVRVFFSAVFAVGVANCFLRQCGLMRSELEKHRFFRLLKWTKLD